MMNRQVKALGFLLISGFLGGFFLTSGSARYLTFAPRVAAAEEPQKEVQQAARPTKKDGKHGGMEQEGGRQGMDAPADARKGKAKPAKDQEMADEEDGDDTPKKAAPVTAAELTGRNALEFLAGNTVRINGDDDDVTYQYFSRRGWRGDKTGTTLVAHRWVSKENRLCDIRADESVACETITIRPERSPKKDSGALLGNIVYSDQKTLPVYRGNVAAFPENIPLIEGPHDTARTPQPKAASAIGKEALKGLIDHPLLSVRNRTGLRAFYYEPDGRWIEVQPLVRASKSAAGGVAVSVGQWRFVDGTFCQQGSGLELSQACFRPEQWGETTFRLVPTAAGPAETLMVLADQNDKP